MFDKKEYSRRYYLEHKTEKIEYNRRYYLEHRGERLAYRHRYYLEHKGGKCDKDCFNCKYTDCIL